MGQLGDGLRVVLVGIAGVFLNLLVLMAVVTALGKVFGKKKKKKAKKKAKKKNKDEGARASEAPGTAAPG